MPREQKGGDHQVYTFTGEIMFRMRMVELMQDFDGRHSVIDEKTNRDVQSVSTGTVG